MRRLQNLVNKIQRKHHPKCDNNGWTLSSCKRAAEQAYSLVPLERVTDKTQETQENGRRGLRTFVRPDVEMYQLNIIMMSS